MLKKLLKKKRVRPLKRFLKKKKKRMELLKKLLKKTNLKYLWMMTIILNYSNIMLYPLGQEKMEWVAPPPTDPALVSSIE